MYLKAQEAGANKQQLQSKITEVCDCFYNLRLVQGQGPEESKGGLNMQMSLSSTQFDEADKIKASWAFNFPCVLLVNGGKPYWQRVAKEVYRFLAKDVLITVRKSLAASLVEICRLIGLNEDLDENDDRTFMVEVANQLLGEADEIKLNLLPNLCEFVSLFPVDN